MSLLQVVFFDVLDREWHNVSIFIAIHYKMFSLKLSAERRASCCNYTCRGVIVLLSASPGRRLNSHSAALHTHTDTQTYRHTSNTITAANTDRN